MKLSWLQRFLLKKLQSYMPDAENAFFLNKHDLLVNNNDMMIFQRSFGRNHLVTIPLDNLSFHITFTRTFGMQVFYWLTLFLSIATFTLAIISYEINLLLLSIVFFAGYSFSKNTVTLKLIFDDTSISDSISFEQVLRYSTFMNRKSQT